MEGDVTTGAALIVMPNDFVAACDFESVTRTVKLFMTDPEGTPEIAPVPDASVNPAGSDPEMIDQV